MSSAFRRTPSRERPPPILSGQVLQHPGKHRVHSTSDQLACARSTRGEPRAGLLSAAWERILSNDPDDPVELRLHSFVLRPIPCVGHFFALPAETPSGGRRGENFTPSSRRAPGSSALQERRAPPARAGVRPAAFLREAALASPGLDGELPISNRLRDRPRQGKDGDRDPVPQPE